MAIGYSLPEVFRQQIPTGLEQFQSNVKGISSGLGMLGQIRLQQALAQRQTEQEFQKQIELERQKNIFERESAQEAFNIFNQQFQPQTIESKISPGQKIISPDSLEGISPNKQFGKFQKTDEALNQRQFLFNPFTKSIMQNPNFTSPLEMRREKRLEGKEDRLDTERDFRALNEFGGILTKDQLSKFSNSFGFDFGSDLSEDVGTGRIQRLSKNGEKAFKVISEKEFSRLIQEGQFAPEEQKHIRILAEEKNAWTRVVRRLEEIGVKQDQPLGKIEFEKTDNPFLR